MVNPARFAVYFFVFALMLASIGVARAQSGIDPLTGYSKRPEVGGTYQSRILPDTPIGGADSQHHRDFAGKPCLALTGGARPFVTNPKLFDHIIRAENSCPTAIKVQTCYLQSTSCVSFEVPGYGRKEIVLGTMPGQKDFQFQFQEKF